MRPERGRRRPGSLALAARLLGVALLACSGVEARPNIVLIIGDDISWDDFGCYGNPHIATPHIDRLAAAGLRFDNAFLTASSCSPSRTSVLTGRYPHNNGAASELHRPRPWQLPTFPAELRAAGYYTLLSGKHHMPVEPTPPGALPPLDPFQVVDAGRVEGNRGGHGNWVRHLRERPRSQPFFFWFASYDAHRAWDADEEWDEGRFGPKQDSRAVRVPPFLVDNPETRADLASYYNEVRRFDSFVGEVVAELQRQEILGQTLIVVTADNGRPFPRAKTRLHDSGMKAPLIVHWPAGIRQAGRVVPALVSAIDLAPTFLELAAAELPSTLQGVSLTPLLKGADTTVRRYAFSEHNWHDYEAHARSVRDGSYLYIANQRPQLAWQGPADSVRSPSHVALQALRQAGSLSAAQADVFRQPRPIEELYETASDPRQLKNLIAIPAHREARTRLRRALEAWREETADSVPTGYSRDGFDRETGEFLGARNDQSHYGTPPGADRQAHRVNRAGPR